MSDAPPPTEQAPAADQEEISKFKWKLRGEQSKLAFGIFLILMPPVFFCDRSFGQVGWGVSLFCCFAGFLVHRLLPVFLGKRNLPLQDVVRVQLAFQGVPFLFGLMALVNPSLLKVDLPVPTNVMSAVIGVSSLVGVIIVISTLSPLQKLAKDPTMAKLPKPVLK